MIHSYAILDVDKESKSGRVYSKKVLTSIRKKIKGAFKDGKPYYAVIEPNQQKLMHEIDVTKIIGEISDARISKGELIVDINVDYEKPYEMGEKFEKTIRDLNPLEYGFTPVGYGTVNSENVINDDYVLICINFISKNPLQKQ
jgi:hypothetical protein